MDNGGKNSEKKCWKKYQWNAASSVVPKQQVHTSNNPYDV